MEIFQGKSNMTEYTAWHRIHTLRQKRTSGRNVSAKVRSLVLVNRPSETWPSPSCIASLAPCKRARSCATNALNRWFRQRRRGFQGMRGARFAFLTPLFCLATMDRKENWFGRSAAPSGGGSCVIGWSPSPASSVFDEVRECIKLIRLSKCSSTNVLVEAVDPSQTNSSSR